MADETGKIGYGLRLFCFENPLQVPKRCGYVDMQYLADGLPFLSFSMGRGRNESDPTVL